MRIALACHSFYRRASGKAQPEQLGRLVEGLAQGVVDRGAQALVLADIVDK